MPAAIRFHLDEHVATAVATGLRIRGVDVTTTAEAGLIGAGDQQQVAFARQQRRVLVTHDDDFLSRAAAGMEHWGICYSHQQSRTVRELVEMLFLLHECYTEEDMQGRVEFL